MSFLYDSLSFCQFLRLAGTVFVGEELRRLGLPRYSRKSGFSRKPRQSRKKKKIHYLNNKQLKKLKEL